MNAHTPPQEGSNTVLTPEDRKVLLLHHVGDILKIEDKIAELNEQKKKARRLAKADGFDLGVEVDLAIKLSRAEDDSVIAANLAKQLQVAAYFSLPVNQQLALPLETVDGLDRVYDEGVRAGFLALERKSPYAEGSDEEQAFLRGYDDAQKKAGEVMERAMAARNAEAKPKATIVKKKGKQSEAAEADESFADA